LGAFAPSPGAGARGRQPSGAQRAGRRRGHGDLTRTIRGSGESVGQALAAESALLRALPVEAFDPREQSSPRVDSKALVTVKQNRYSAPVAPVGRKVLVKIGAREVEIFHEHREVSVPRAPAGSLRGDRTAGALPGAARAQARRPALLTRAAPGA
jgi:hypothetical protein